MIEVSRFVTSHLGTNCTMDIFDEDCMWVEGKTLKRLREVAKLVESEYQDYRCVVEKMADAKLLKVYRK